VANYNPDCNPSRPGIRERLIDDELGDIDAEYAMLQGELATAPGEDGGLEACRRLLAKTA
jgi:hypothetical protein